MIEEAVNLLMALVSVTIALLDPMLQLANGVDLYMEAVKTSPLIVSCPPRVQNGSWVCSDRRPLPECFLYCPSGLLPADGDQVDCETYRQDNSTNFACVPVEVVVIGGLDEQDRPVAQMEVFSADQRHLGDFDSTKLQPMVFFKNHSPKAEDWTSVTASSEWYTGRLVTCGGVYQKSCSTLKLEGDGGGFEPHSVLRNLQEGTSSAVLGPGLQLRGSINNSTRSSSQVFTEQEGWRTGKRLSQDAYQSCSARINATHVAISGGESNPGWLSIVSDQGEVA